MQNKRGNVVIISVMVIIVATTVSVITWLVVTKSQMPVSQSPIPQQSAEKQPEVKLSGMDYASAIVVTANSEDTGVKWEYDWLKVNGCKNNGGYNKPAGQALQSENDHWYDVITAICTDGKKIDYYFMIDNYFGKL